MLLLQAGILKVSVAFIPTPRTKYEYPHIQFFCVGQISWGIKLAKHLQPATESKHAWSCTSTPPCGLMWWYSIKHANFIFIFYHRVRSSVSQVCGPGNVLFCKISGIIFLLLFAIIFICHWFICSLTINEEPLEFSAIHTKT
jgi:hypothetical protein